MISVFIPCYNEEDIIEENTLRVYEELKKLGKDFELIIVDDSSTDKSMGIASEMAVKHPGIKYLRYENGPSRRENLAKAFKKAKGGIIAYMDLDLATDLKHLPELIGSVEEGHNIAIGSRYKGKKAEREMSRRIISVFYNNFMRHYFGSKIKDHQCGFCAFKKDVILELVREMGYDKEFVRGWFWNVELLVRAQKKGYSIKEFPVEWRRGDSSSFIYKREFRMLKHIRKFKKEIKGV